MTNPPPRPPDPRRSARVSRRPGRIARWRLSDPVRLYCWPVLLVLVIDVAYLVTTGQWSSCLLVGVAAASLFGAVEAARVSVYSINGHVESLLQRDAAARLDQAAGW